MFLAAEMMSIPPIILSENKGKIPLHLLLYLFSAVYLAKGYTSPGNNYHDNTRLNSSLYRCVV